MKIEKHQKENNSERNKISTTQNFLETNYYSYLVCRLSTKLKTLSNFPNLNCSNAFRLADS